MLNFGFIGFGSMAKMIMRGLIAFSDISPSRIYATRKNKDKLHEIADSFKGVTAVDSCHTIMKDADIIFLCVKPLEYKAVLAEIAPLMTSDTHIVSIAGGVSIDNLQSMIHGKITKYMPTLPSEVGAGVSLICHNDQVSEREAAAIESILSGFSDKIKHVEDGEDWGFAAELTSCMPGLIASIFENLTHTALKHTNSFDKATIDVLVTDTLFATAKLIAQTGMSFEQAVSRVATKGGITEEGALIFDQSLPQVFDEMFAKTLAKRRLMLEKIHLDFASE
jgi:pyrroline-5-carboxylate reductase